MKSLILCSNKTALNQIASCSSRMFNRTGILYAHGLKVLDLMNIKILPTHYVLKRWTREARKGSIQDREGRNVVENPKLEAQLQYKFLCHKFQNLAYKAASSPECCLLLVNGLDCLGTQLEDKLNACTGVVNENPFSGQENADPNVQERDALRATQLKKKEVQSKTSKRLRTWLDKLCKVKRKPTKSAVPAKKKAKQKKKKGGAEPQVEGEHDGKNKGEVELQEYTVIDSFTQLITVPTLANLDLQDLF